MKTAIFIAIVVFVLFFIYTDRYRIFPMHEVAYRLDKWTGEITYLSGTREYSTRKIPPKKMDIEFEKKD